MTSVVTYKDNAREAFCQIKFDSGERALISIAAIPKPSVKIMRMALGGIFPVKTIWEYNSIVAGGPDAYVHNMMEMFPPDNGSIKPLDIIRDVLLQCSSLEEAYHALIERQGADWWRPKTSIRSVGRS